MIHPALPGTLTATVLIIIASVILILSVVGGLFGLYHLVAWLFSLS